MATEHTSGPPASGHVPVDEIDLSQQPTTHSWTPRWVFEFQDYDFGFTEDDHCLVPLMKTEQGRWQPTPWVPREAALKMAELAELI